MSKVIDVPAEDVVEESIPLDTDETVQDGELQDKEIVLEPMSRKEVETLFGKMHGIVFKIDDGFFKITYENLGHRRFSATLLNPDR